MWVYFLLGSILVFLLVLVSVYFAQMFHVPTDIQIPEYRQGMRVAVIVTGYFGNTNRETLTQLKTHVLEPLKADCFIVDDISDGGHDAALEILGPRAVHRCDYSVQMDTPLYSLTKNSHFFEMFSKMNDGARLRREYEEKHGITYDIVIVMRPDLVFITPIPDAILRDVLANKEAIFCPSKDVYHDAVDTYGFSDQLFMGSPRAIDSVCVSTAEIELVLNDLTNPLCVMNEYIIYKYCERKGIQIIPFSMSFCISRFCTMTYGEWIQEALDKKGVVMSKDVCSIIS